MSGPGKEYGGAAAVEPAAEMAHALEYVGVHVVVDHSTLYASLLNSASFVGCA